MKFIRLLSLISLCLLSATSALAQSYTITKIVGKPVILKNATPTPLVAGKKVTGNDRLRINKNQAVWLLESTKKAAVYKLVIPTLKSGKSVNELVAEANQHNATTIADINNTIIKNINGGKSGLPDFNKTGASRVVTNTGATKTQLASLIGPDAVAPQAYRPVKTKNVSDGDGTFHFSFKNESSAPLYANVILKDTDKDNIDFLYPANLILAPENITELADIQFLVPDAQSAGYILILSNQPFTQEDIVKQLDVKTIDLSRDFIYEII